MPELAEVEVITQQLHSSLQGQTLQEINLVHTAWLKVGDPTLQTGHRVTAIKRWGKRLQFEWSNQAVWVGSLGMTGTVRLDNHHLAHPMLHASFSNSELTWYDPRRFGSLLVFESFSQAREALQDKIGIDARSPLTGLELQSIFQTKVGIKAALLDQRWIAGIGNYLADEILWESQVHPGQSVKAISSSEWEAISQARLRVIERAIEAGGLSARDYKDISGNLGSMSGQLAVYGRGGDPCLRCGTNLNKDTIAARSTVWCPHCQKRQN
jgi:formamidopyrimidine-DNA glycosylase